MHKAPRSKQIFNGLKSFWTICRLSFSPNGKFLLLPILQWKLLFSFLGAGEEKGGLGALNGAQKWKNFRWPEMHSELSVSCFFIQWQVCFTANFAMETSVFFLGGKGWVRTPLTPSQIRPWGSYYNLKLAVLVSTYLTLIVCIYRLNSMVKIFCPIIEHDREQRRLLKLRCHFTDLVCGHAPSFSRKIPWLRVNQIDKLTVRLLTKKEGS